MQLALFYWSSFLIFGTQFSYLFRLALSSPLSPSPNLSLSLSLALYLSIALLLSFFLSFFPFLSLICFHGLSFFFPTSLFLCFLIVLYFSLLSLSFDPFSFFSSFFFILSSIYPPSPSPPSLSLSIYLAEITFPFGLMPLKKAWTLLFFLSLG